MSFKQSTIVLVLLINLYHGVLCKNRHIVMMIGDDIGYNDCSLHGSNQIPTPNIDAIGYNGVTFKRFYTQQSCSPSRTAILTGSYPIRQGMQGTPLVSGEPRALFLNVPIIAEYFKALGYSTHLVGKWHLGHENKSVIPTGRGFNTHSGHWNGFMGYYSHNIRDQIYTGYDYHVGTVPDFSKKGVYATDLYTDEANKLIMNHNTSNSMFLIVSHLAAHTGEQGMLLETPDLIQAKLKYSYIDDLQRKIYADVVNRMDSSIGSIVQTLKKQNMLDDTILIYMNDNGSPTVGLFENSGSNWPFKGIKETMWEGAVRNLGVIWCKDLKFKNFIYNDVFHMVDLLPTLYESTGNNVSDLGKIDGVSHWSALSEGTKQPLRNRGILININEKENNSAILSPDGRYKLVQGNYQFGQYNYYFGDSGREDDTPEYDINEVLSSDVNQALSTINTQPPLTEQTILDIRSSLAIQQSNGERTKIDCSFVGDKYCLFDLSVDPTETTDILAQEPEIFNQLKQDLDQFKLELVPQRNKKFDISSFPGNCNCAWYTWKDPADPCPVEKNYKYLTCPPLISGVPIIG